MNFSICDLAVEGSPSSSTLMSPRIPAEGKLVQTSMENVPDSKSPFGQSDRWFLQEALATANPERNSCVVVFGCARIPSRSRFWEPAKSAQARAFLMSWWP